MKNSPAAPIYQLKVTLAEVGPPVWRRIRVRGDLSLERLHAVVQRAMGWHDSHLHEWTVEGAGATANPRRTSQSTRWTTSGR